MRLKNKVALLTGAAGGMGEAHARRLIAEGARLVMTDLNVAAGKALASELGDKAVFAEQDISNEQDWQGIVALASDTFGGIDVLVNNAGIHTYGSIADESVATLRQVLDVNVAGTWMGIKYVSPVMQQGGGGSIINLASMVAERGLPDYSIYGCSKWAVRGITKHAAAELGPLNIRVNAILPGAIDNTGMFSSAAMADRVDEMRETTPLRRFGQSEDVSSLVVYLASDESRFTTGADHMIDGGRGI